MPSYPLKGPIVYEPMGPTQGWADLRATTMEPVMAPEAGQVLYVGDGTHEPYDGVGPGVVVIKGRRSGLVHVLGFLDGATTSARWGGRMGRTQTPKPRTPVLSFNWPWEWGRSPGDYPAPEVNEGETIGYVSAARKHLRWEIRDPSPGGVSISPTQWAYDNGITGPATILTAPAAPPPRRSSGSGVLIVILMLAAATSGRRRRR